MFGGSTGFPTRGKKVKQLFLNKSDQKACFYRRLTLNAPLVLHSVRSLKKSLKTYFLSYIVKLRGETILQILLNLFQIHVSGLRSTGEVVDNSAHVDPRIANFLRIAGIHVTQRSRSWYRDVRLRRGYFVGVKSH